MLICKEEGLLNDYVQKCLDEGQYKNSWGRSNECLSIKMHRGRSNECLFTKMLRGSFNECLSKKCLQEELMNAFYKNA